MNLHEPLTQNISWFWFSRKAVVRNTFFVFFSTARGRNQIVLRPIRRIFNGSESIERRTGISSPHRISAVCVPLVPGNNSGNAYGNHHVPFIPVPFPFQRWFPRGGLVNSLCFEVTIFSRQNSKLGFFLSRVRGMSDAGCGEERVAGEHGCAGGAGGEFRGTSSDS